MSIYKMGKIVLALLLSVGLAFPAAAATQTIYQSDDKTITVTADVTQKSVTYTDANGNEQSYSYSTVDASSIQITISGLVYDSPNGGTEEKYYAWTEDGFVTDGITAGTADVTAKYAENELNGIYNDGGTNNTYDGKDISADFVGDHHEYSTGSTNYGGAVFNLGSQETTATLGTITGNFIGDYESSENATAEYGGAIANSAQSGGTAIIDAINGNFIGNYAISNGSQVYGGAILNYVHADPSNLSNTGVIAKIGSITGNFVGNYIIQNGNAYGIGGAIYNRVNVGNNQGAIIGDIAGNFIGNYISGANDSHGGAIANEGYDSPAIIGGITGDFIGNYVESSGGEACGGAIFNRGVYYNYSGSGQIGNITGNFIGNYVKTSGTGTYSVALGGAIVNMTEQAKAGYTEGIIGNITGNFIGNYAEASGNAAAAGAILNYGDVGNDSISKMGNITGDFIGNYAYSTGGAADGGAILNWGGYNGTTCQIGDITGNFIGNYAKSTSETVSNCSASSGAINNYAQAENSTVTIGDITGNFIGNYAESAAGYTWAGAIANRAWADGTTATIGTIQGNFIGNYASATELYAYGGAIVNLVTTGTTGKAQIASIQNSTFIDNYASSEKDVSYGGAIYNQGYIGTADANGNVSVAGISNSVFQGNEADRGGAIYNGSEKTEGEEFNGTYTCILSSIENTSFVGNKADMFGGAIYNYDVGAIYKILNCYFEGNVASSGNGGAIENAEANSFIGEISGSYFKGNYVETGTHGGGAIYNEGIINSLTKNTFADNWSGNFGGALYNNGGTIGGDGSGESITGNYFSGNYSDRGGAIYNTKTRTLITVNNDGKETQEQILDLDSYGQIMSIDGNSFVNNWANNFGGAIYNYHGGEIGSISNNYFEGNQAKGGNGGAVENAEFDTTIGNMDGNVFVKNSATGNGGAIYNQGTIGIERGSADDGDKVTGGISNSTFVENSATNGGAICNNAGSDTMYVFPGEGSSGTTTKLTDATTGTEYTVETNPVVGAGAIGDIVNCYFEGNTATENGGAIYNASREIEGEYYTCTINSVTNSSFINNSAGENGGAIYTTSDLSIVADGSQTGGTVVFKDNSDGTDDNAIYMAENAEGTVSNLSFSLKNGGTIFMYDNIKGEGNYSVDISGDGLKNIFYLLNDVNAVSEVSPTGIKLYGAEDDTNNADLSVGGVSLYTTQYTLSDEVHTYKMNSFTVKDNFDMYADVDFANEVMDHFETSDGEGKGTLTEGADENGHSGTLNVAGLNGLTDTDEDRVAIYFAESGLMKNVTSSAGTVYAPIFTYSANYVYLDDENGGQKIYDANGNEYDVANSELFSSGTYENAGYFVFDKTGFNPAVMGTSYATMGAYNAFGMMFDYNFEHSDYYMKLPEDVRLAMSEERKQAKKAPKENDPTRNAYYNQHELTYHGAWTRSFFSNESVDYGGWSSRDKYYGAMVGFDTDMHVNENGWATVTTGYAGTLGIRQQYSGGHIKQHGGFIGVTESFYKKNFYNAWTIAAGTMKAHEHTMYGKDKDRIDQYGIATRLGWNIKLDDEGKYTLLPTFTASYTYVHPEDFTNAGGVHIAGSGFRAVQLNPNVKLIWNRDDGWQPYVTLGEVWTVADSIHLRANGEKLDELDLDPYTEYGIGIQKRWAYEKDAYVQFMGHSHGRDGFLVNAGIRWNF